MGTTRFERKDIAAFFTMLPRELNLLPPRHAIEAGQETPEGLPNAHDPADSCGHGGEVFAFVINGAEERAPAAAMALAGEVKGSQ